MDEMTKNINENMEKIKHVIIIISGKGGVGKTTVSVNLAMNLASIGHRVGIMDVDITGPNVNKMLGIDSTKKPIVNTELGKFYPVNGPLNIKVMSMAFLLESSDSPVIWRGPMKMGAVRQFLGDVLWGDLDYLICDLPPGTSDETLDILQLIPEENVIIVSTPQEVALMDARKTIKMAQIMKRNVLGIIENMSGFKCPHCSKEIDLYPPGGAEKAAIDFNIPLLGKIPFDIDVGIQGDQGLPFIIKNIENKSAKSFKQIVDKIQMLLEK
ncbi:MAG: Mrp/NBP35 family ATP-binding protein [Candidatus Lokiarchaeota archaeon]|nr:Mrp/NBP35 family ATP-binding protein [Candidatus Lokiarchaeota archaeon]